MGEKGYGFYFYIENSKDITRIMSHSIHNLVGLVGSNCIVHFAPEEGKLLKVYGCEKVSDGYVIGDLTDDGVANILLKIEVPSVKKVKELKLFSYVVRYVSNEESRREVKIEGDFSIPCTNDILDVTINREVLISKKLKEHREKNIVVKELIKNQKLNEAIEMKKEALKELKEFQDDTSGRVKVILDLEEQGLKLLEDQSSMSKKSGSKVNLMNKTGISKAKKQFDSCDYMVANDNNANWDYNDAEDSSSAGDDNVEINNVNKNDDDDHDDDLDDDNKVKIIVKKNDLDDDSDSEASG